MARTVASGEKAVFDLQHQSVRGHSFIFPGRGIGLQPSMPERAQTRIGLALEGNAACVTLQEIADNIPVRLRSDTQFILLSGDHHDTTTFNVMKVADLRRQMQNSRWGVTILQQIDILLSFDNDVARLAGSMGIPVWLLNPCGQAPDVSFDVVDKRFNNISVFQQHTGETWGDVFRRVSFLRLMYPELTRFEPICEDISLLTQDTPVSITCDATTTSELENIFCNRHVDFSQVNIETTSICNLSCSYCPNSSVPRPKEFMTEETFTRIIDSIHEYNRDYDGVIAPHLYGEPLLDKRLEQFIAYSRWRLPKAKIELFSNGETLTVSRYLSLKHAGTDLFRISMHRPESQARILDTLNTIKTQFPQLYSVEYNTGYNATNLMNRGGLVDVHVEPIVDKYFARCACYRDLVFNVHGDAILCCNDYLGSHTFGNIHQTTIREIWQSPKNCRVRNSLLLGYLPLPICRRCMHIIGEESPNTAGT